MDITNASHKINFAKIVKKIWDGPYQDTDLDVEETAPMNRDRTDNMHFNTGAAQQNEFDQMNAMEQNRGSARYRIPSSQQENPEDPFNVKERRNVTVISEGTTITGNIKSDSDIEMLGTMTGSIMTSGNVKISGKQDGDVQGAGIDLFACTVRGCLNAADAVHVDSNSVIVGDIKCGDLTIDGKMKGNVHVMGNVSCEGSAVVIGDITSTTVTISSGAKLKGKVEISDGSIEPVDLGDGDSTGPVPGDTDDNKVSQ
ncbi:MAG: polymer-forming cytoskeletal protein [Oscillospiraceae bacterium]|jgi:cytoskeletal protein CcmA (bactofilin family)|nr:polymer-forming cytoskeletal protein [Oscillospiraceae bacterium]